MTTKGWHGSRRRPRTRSNSRVRWKTSRSATFEVEIVRDKVAHEIHCHIEDLFLESTSDEAGKRKGLAKVVAFMRCWLTRRAGAPRTVRLEIDGDVIEPSHASSSETDRLVELFLARHSPTEPMR